MKDILDFIMDELAVLIIFWGMAIGLFWEYVKTENWFILLAWVPFAFFAYIKLMRFVLDLKDGSWRG